MVKIIGKIIIIFTLLFEINIIRNMGFGMALGIMFITSVLFVVIFNILRKVREKYGKQTSKNVFISRIHAR